MSQKNLIFIVALILLIASFPIIFLKNISLTKNSEAEKRPTAEVTLEFWGLWDNSDSWQKVIDKFEKEDHVWNGQDVKVKINYTKKDISSYETEIRNSYCENKSPSIYTINNYWLGRYIGKLEPLSGKVSDIDEYNLLDYEKLQDIFPPNILREAFSNDNQMFAVPVYSDSMALYYNRDLFQKAGIINPPSTWDELKEDVKKLTLLSKGNEIRQSGIALGGGDNITRSCDILSLLMMQGGGKIVDENGNIDFNKKVEIKTLDGIQERQPGITAIQFYTEFSDPGKEVYTWNNSQTGSMQDFANGKTAMMFGFNYQRPGILAAKSDFNYGVAPVPQLPNSTPIDISNYWFPVVSDQKSCTINGGNAENIDCTKIAWSFLSFAAQKENVQDYLAATGKASARTDLIKEESQTNDDISAFAKQATIARSYNKFDDRIDGIFIGMIDAINSNRGDWEKEVDEAAAGIEALKNK